MTTSNYSATEVRKHGELAVFCSDVVKRYANTGAPALNHAALQVPRNSIYALLGPSGCGKTTLLRCVTGRLHAQSGVIEVFGKTPSELGQKRLGGLIGYMPQEFALHSQLTLSDTLFFFGRVFGMSTAEIRERMQFLLTFLELPEASRLVSNLSGGQQRRASLAVALLHSPPLLVLDEPTVGVDPLLREKIWHYLRDLVSTTHVSVIITTHYIEEARQADIVALMRNGQMLVEASPNWIMQRLSVSTLEAAFVELCRRQGFDPEAERKKRNRTNQDELSEQVQVQVQVVRPQSSGLNADASELIAVNTVQENAILQQRESEQDYDTRSSRASLIDKPQVPPGRAKCTVFGLSGMNIAAIFIRNVTIMSRMVGFLVFQFLLPALQITLFCWCVGPTPHGLPLAVVNLDHGFFGFKLSTNFTNYIDPNTVIQQPFDSLDLAVESVKRGDTFGVMLFKENYTFALQQRIEDPKSADANTVDQSEVHLYLDFTNVQIALVFQQQIALAFQKSVETLLIAFHQSPKLAESFIKIEEPIYGALDASNLEYMAPGILTSIPYFLAIGLTALSFVTEAKTGILDRCLVSGVNMVEVMLALGGFQLIIMLAQVGVTLTIALAGFHIDSQGSIMLVLLLVIVTGLSAMGIGLVISACTSEEMSAIQLAMGIVYPNIMLCGLMWPVQAMPSWLQPFSRALPLTYSSEAVRSVLGRGWGFEHLVVWLGLLVPIAWTVCTFALAAFIMYLRKR